jgi:hypothetical protein
MNDVPSALIKLLNVNEKESSAGEPLFGSDILNVVPLELENGILEI